MSDPDSDVASTSSRSTSSRRASLQPGNEPPNEAAIHETEGDDVAEGDSHSKEAASATSSTSDLAAHGLFVEWQDEELQEDEIAVDERFRPIDFVVIPGIYADWSDGIGACLGSGSSAWVPEYAGKVLNGGPPDSGPRTSCRVLRFEYSPLIFSSGRRSRQEIHEVGLRLLRGLNAAGKAQKKRRPIYFIAHDLGGIIVKDALVTAALEKQAWLEISEMARAVIFKSCPHRCFNTSDLQDRLTRFLFQGNKSASQNPFPVSSIPGLSDGVNQINGLFIDSKVALRTWIVNLYANAGESSETDVHPAFDSFSGNMGLPLEIRLPHSQESDYEALKMYLRTLEHDTIQPIGEAQYRYERQLLAVASPIYPFKTAERSNPLSQLPEYQAWLHNLGPQILYLHGRDDLPDIAEQVFYSLERLTNLKRRAIVLYFSFNHWDVRCDSIRDMIATFVAQIANHHPRMVQRIAYLFAQLESERGWTERDLIQILERFRTTDEVEETMIVIKNFDECSKGSRKVFLDHIRYRNQRGESRWRIVVTSNKAGALSGELSGPFCVPIDLSKLNLGLEETEGSSSSEVVEILKVRPDLLLKGKQFVEEVEFINGLEPTVRGIVYAQAMLHDEWPEERSIQDILGSLDLKGDLERSDDTLRDVSHRVLTLFSEQAILRPLLTWLLYAVRPLTIWELATALQKRPESSDGHIAPSLLAVEELAIKLQKGLAGVIEVKHNEVRLSSARLHNIMRGDSHSESPAKRYLWDEIRHTAHFDIANTCLAYLSQPAVQDFIEQASLGTNSRSFDEPAIPDRTNLISYALQAWTHHYSLSSNRPNLSILASQERLASNLARGYWALANPITRSPTCLETLFPIFAGLGITGAVGARDEADAFQGLLEAARKGQDNVVQHLTKQYKFSEAQRWEALQAATSSGDQDLMLKLLDGALPTGGQSRDIDWPPVLIYRASWLNLDRFAERILALGCPTDPEVEWKTTMEATPLIQAARTGHIKLVRLLLDHGADTEFTSTWDRKALHVAASLGHTYTVKLILERNKADLERPAEQNFTPLYLAAVFGHHDTVEMLLNMGADPNMGLSSDPSAPDQWTPLIVTTDDGYPRCVQLLLDNGGNPNMNGAGGPPLRWAVRNGHLDIFNSLIAAGADPKSDLLGLPLLIECVGWDFQSSRLPMLERLLELELDVNARESSDERTPLIYAVTCDRAQTIDGIEVYERNPDRERAVKLLLDHGADPDLRGKTGDNALHHAASRNQDEIVRMLLEKGADPNMLNNEGEAPLFHSLRKAETVQLLIERGAKTDAVTKRGWTGLTFAASYGHEDSVKALLNHGAAVDLVYGDGVPEPDQPRFKGWTPLMFAAAGEHSGIVRLLIEAGANVRHKAVEFDQPVIHQAAMKDTLPIFLEYAARVDLNQVDSDGWTALHSMLVSLDNVKRLVNAGAELEITNKRGDTALTIEVCYDFERTKYLLDKGANLHHMSPWYGSALHQACRAPNLDMVKLLVERGADVNQISDSHAGTPLQALCLRYSGDTSVSSCEQIARFLMDEEEETRHSRPPELRADVTIKAGILGFAINAAAFAAPPSVINLYLEQEGVTVDVEDDVGRMPIHFAALNGIRNLEIILDRGGDIHAKDKLGRTALHWAAHGGRLQAVERIISLLDDKKDINATDIDGWTPLCWAARGTSTWLHEEYASETAAQTDVITFLLEHGADPTVMVKVGDEEWSAVGIAQYHGSSREVISMLRNRPASNDTSGQEPGEGPSTIPGQMSNGKEKPRVMVGVAHQSWFCDGCFARAVGFTWNCTTDPWLGYCFKCQPHVALVHSSGHEYTKEGTEAEFDENKPEDAVSVTSGSSSSDSDDDSDSSKDS